MTPRAYYNENDPAAAHVLRVLVRKNIIAPGDVDDRSIKDVSSDDLRGFAQCHFFAGGGLWSVAARLAGWPDGRPLWTGSCPCQSFSVAGNRRGADDPRHLWPDFFRLIRTARPAVVVGEQVAGTAGYGWFDGVSADLASENYASRAVDFAACAIDAPHIRNRLYWVALCVGHADRREWRQNAEERDDVVNWPDAGRQEAPSRFELAGPRGLGDMVDGERRWLDPAARASFWRGADLRIGADGKARRVEPGIRLLVDGLPGRVGLLRIGGNAIVPPAAAEVLGALRETLDGA